MLDIFLQRLLNFIKSFSMRLSQRHHLSGNWQTK